jgi:polysaccharide biosynthesis/export protein
MLRGDELIERGRAYHASKHSMNKGEAVLFSVAMKLSRCTSRRDPVARPSRSKGLVLTVGVLVSLLVSSGCASAPPYDYKTEPDPRRVEFQVGPLDLLSVVVWKNRDMSADVTVRPDGIVTLPLIGDVKAAGRTPTELQKEITKRFSDFIRGEELVVSVGVSAVNSYNFTVIGAVERAGYYSPRSYVTTVEAVAMAGGPNRFAGNFVYILRGNPARRIPIDLRRATSSETANENLVVMRGDLIVIP